MLHFLLFAIAPALISANGLAEWQEPLSRHPGGTKCGRGRKGLHYGSAFSFFLNGDWRYYFSDYFPGDWQCSRGELTPLSMRALDDISNRIAPPRPPSDTGTKKSTKSKQKGRAVSLMLTIPQGTEEEGPLIIEPDPQWKLFHEWDLSVEINWAKSKLPGRGLNITSIGIRDGSTATSKTSNIPLNLGTPYLKLPNDIFDYLAASTKPQRTDMGRGIKPVDTVDCNAFKDFPNIILDFNHDGFELVVKPEQYILRVNDAMGGLFKGKCVLLVSRGGEVSIGWAAMRGAFYGIVELKDDGKITPNDDFKVVKAAYAKAMNPTGDGGVETSGKASTRPLKQERCDVSETLLPDMPTDAKSYMNSGAGTGPVFKGLQRDGSPFAGKQSEGTATAGSGQPTKTPNGVAASASSWTGKSAAIGMKIPSEFVSVIAADVSMCAALLF